MTTLREAAQQAKQVPLRELLASVPADARLVIDDADGKGTRFIPVGRLCQEAAAALAEPTVKESLQVPAEVAITALKAALAEPVQDGKCQFCTDGCPACDARKLPVQEPVAVISVDRLSKMFESVEGMDRSAPGYHWRTGWNDALRRAMDYTAPPQRKPLTEEEIDNIWDSEKAFADIYAIARAIERAHGIKE